MAERQWTNEQNNAINSRGGTLLLSAAAGSGKTAVLVERIIRLLTDKASPISPEELLVVTFTNAAAAEMRSRIADAVNELIAKSPTDVMYRNIRMKLPEAQISTIDSFCIKLVRDNFHSADILPDFALLDNSESEILSAEAMADTLDDLSRNDSEVYELLNTMTSYGRDDGSLASKIIKLYNYSLSHPFPDKWLGEILDMYRNDGNITGSLWGKIIIENAEKTIDFCKKLLLDAMKASDRCDAIADKYHAAISDIFMRLDDYNEILKGDDWQAICDFVRKFSIPSAPRAPAGYADDENKVYAKARYDKVKSLIDKCQGTFCADETENEEDSIALLPVVEGLVMAVRSYDRNLEKLKSERNAYSFSDIMHKAIKLVADENGERTALAKSLSEQYREILLDEYQDTNEAQDMLFTMISRNGGNMFMVGDVKQSIYSFRLAMPEIFVDKARAYADYDGKTYPSKIILGKNFRSRKGVLDNINYLFKNLMSYETGGIDYNDSEALYFGGGYDEDTEPAVEMHFVEKDAGADKSEAEAVYISGIIKNMINSGVTVNGKNGKRKATFGDFCILLRSPKNKSDIYVEALEKNGVGATAEKSKSLYDTPEINIFMSLLKIINNPSDDVAMLSVMFSPLYGFTPDKVSVIKLENRKAHLYSCLLKSTDKKSEKFLSDIDEYRNLSSVMPLDLFVRTLLEVTGYTAIVSAMKNGETRKLNLIMFCEIASKYDAGGGSGLGGFIRFIDKAKDNGAEIPAASEVSENADVVRIMSIHKSKGLEFPFVIIADCAKNFNLMDANEDMLVGAKTGVGMVHLESENLKKYPTLGYSASKLSIINESISEELRILYVAMTRAKERLIAVSTVNSIEKEVNGVLENLTDGGTVLPFAVLNARSYRKWFLMGLLTHRDMKPLTENNEFADIKYRTPESRIKLVCSFADVEESENEEIENEIIIDDDIISELRERAEYEYPYNIPTEIKPKRIASGFEKERFSSQYFAKSKPEFLYDGKLTAAQTGTANHIFLQCCDFGCSSVEDECERLYESGILSTAQKESIRIDKMKKFFTSDLFGRISKAEKVYREKDFTVNIPVSELGYEVDDNIKDEKILVLGKADIVFVENGQAVVADYKTDRGKTENQFIENYRGQLEVYKNAVQQVLGLPVKEMIIYSLDLEKSITVD